MELMKLSCCKIDKTYRQHVERVGHKQVLGGHNCLKVGHTMKTKIHQMNLHFFFIDKFKLLFQLKYTNTGWLSANTYGQSFCGFLHRAKFPQFYAKVVDLNWHLHFQSSHCQLHDIHYRIQIGIRLVRLLEHCKNYLERYKSCLERHMNCLVVVASSSLVVLPASKSHKQVTKSTIKRKKQNL